MVEERDYKPRSSPGIIDEFMKSVLYGDFVAEVELRIEKLRDLLEEASSKGFLEVQGGIRFARQVLDIFEDLKNARESDLEEEERNRQTEEGEL